MVDQYRFSPGMIGLASGGTLRSDDYIGSILGLQKPVGTVFKKHTGLGPANPFNAIGQEFLKRPELEWLFLTNDDNLYPPDTLMRLLARMYYSGTRVDIITGLYLSRFWPHEPVLFDDISREPTGPNGEREIWFQRRFLSKDDGGMVPITACGDGCLLIHRIVLKKLVYPWWEYGLTLSDACDHDMMFSAKCREAGFKMWADLDVKVDHVAQFIVRPNKNTETGEWNTLYVQSDKALSVPAATKPAPEEEVQS